ncbi:MAG: sigma-70 family RNA polymerase sigma factor [Idiomarina sp.]
MVAQVIAAQERFLDDDSPLVERAQAGDMQAFQRLFQRHQKRVFGLVYRLCNDTSYAEDLAQEVFVQVWHKLSSFRGESKFSTWLHTVATRVAIGELRKQQRWFRRVRLRFADETVPEQSVDAPADLGELDKHIQRLPEKTRWVFVLHALEGLRHDEIAEQLNIAVGTSKAQFHRARGLLEEWLSNE